MRATEILMEEHRAIERVLSSLERATNRLNRGEDVYLRFFSGCSAFFRGFVDNCHHKKEEQFLFPALIENGIPKESGPIAVMLAEHAQGRYLAQMLGSATMQFQAGDVRKREELIISAAGYIKLFRQHIYKEEHVLSPLAEKIIPLEQQINLTQSFESMLHEDLGEDIHAKYFGLAERLERESVRNS